MELWCCIGDFNDFFKYDEKKRVDIRKIKRRLILFEGWWRTLVYIISLSRLEIYLD